MDIKMNIKMKGWIHLSQWKLSVLRKSVYNCLSDQKIMWPTSSARAQHSCTPQSFFPCLLNHRHALHIAEPLWIWHTKTRQNQERQTWVAEMDLKRSDFDGHLVSVSEQFLSACFSCISPPHHLTRAHSCGSLCLHTCYAVFRCVDEIRFFIRSPKTVLCLYFPASWCYGIKNIKSMI